MENAPAVSETAGAFLFSGAWRPAGQSFSLTTFLINSFSAFEAALT